MKSDAIQSADQYNYLRKEPHEIALTGIFKLPQKVGLQVFQQAALFEANQRCAVR